MVLYKCVIIIIVYQFLSLLKHLVLFSVGNQFATVNGHVNAIPNGVSVLQENHSATTNRCILYDTKTNNTFSFSLGLLQKQ